MATLTKVSVTLGLSAGVYTGTAPNFQSCAAGGDQVLIGNGNRMFLYFKNGHTAAQFVKAASQQNCEQGHDHDVGDATASVSIPASGERVLGPFDGDEFKDGNGYLQLTYSGVTSLTVCPFELAARGRG